MCSMWDLSSLPSDHTHTLCFGGAYSSQKGLTLNTHTHRHFYNHDWKQNYRQAQSTVREQ